MSRLTEALKSIATTGMPEGGQQQQEPGIGLHQIIRGGAVEQPQTQQPGFVDRLRQGSQEADTEPSPFSQGLSEVVKQTQAQLGVKTAGTMLGAVLGGAVEQPDQEAAAKRAAAEKRSQMAKNVLSTAVNLAASGIKGTTGLAVRGIFWGVNALRKRSRKEQPASNSPNPNPPQLPPRNEQVIEGEFEEI